MQRSDIFAREQNVPVQVLVTLDLMTRLCTTTHLHISSYRVNIPVGTAENTP